MWSDSLRAVVCKVGAGNAGQELQQETARTNLPFTDTSKEGKTMAQAICDLALLGTSISL